MPLTKLANSAIDGVAGREDDVIGDILNYAGSDLLCYRAEGPRGLVEAQRTHWDPVLAWAKIRARRAVRPCRGRRPCRPAASLARPLERSAQGRDARSALPRST